MRNKIAFIIFMILGLIFGLKIGLVFKKIQIEDAKKVIRQKQCYKYGGWSRE